MRAARKVRAYDATDAASQYWREICWNSERGKIRGQKRRKNRGYTGARGPISGSPRLGGRVRRTAARNRGGRGIRTCSSSAEIGGLGFVNDAYCTFMPAPCAALRRGRNTPAGHGKRMIDPARARPQSPKAKYPRCASPQSVGTVQTMVVRRGDEMAHALNAAEQAHPEHQLIAGLSLARLRVACGGGWRDVLAGDAAAVARA